MNAPQSQNSSLALMSQLRPDLPMNLLPPLFLAVCFSPAACPPGVLPPCPLLPHHTIRTWAQPDSSQHIVEMGFRPLSHRTVSLAVLLGEAQLGTVLITSAGAVPCLPSLNFFLRFFRDSGNFFPASIFEKTTLWRFFLCVLGLEEGRPEHRECSFSGSLEG